MSGLPILSTRPFYSTNDCGKIGNRIVFVTLITKMFDAITVSMICAREFPIYQKRVNDDYKLKLIDGIEGIGAIRT